MTWLKVISGIMDIKAVQWIMLGLIVFFTVFIIIFQVRYNGLKLQHALLETKYTKLNSTLEVQNQKIEEMNKVTQQYQANFEQAKRNEIKISQVNEENKKKLKAFQFKPNSSCEEKVNQVFLQYSSLRRKP